LIQELRVTVFHKLSEAVEKSVVCVGQAEIHRGVVVVLVELGASFEAVWQPLARLLSNILHIKAILL
jgi:hypothetical protein